MRLMARRFGRSCSDNRAKLLRLAPFIQTVDRLQTKGLLKTRMGEATPQRAAAPKRMIRVTPKGVEAAKDFYDAVTRVSRGVSWAAEPLRGACHDYRVCRDKSRMVAGRHHCAVA